MARRRGRLNQYDSQLRRCAISGLRYYESDMIKRKGMWVHPDFADTDMAPHTHVIGAPGIQDIAPYQSYWEYDSSDRLMPRDLTMVDEDRAYSWWQTDSLSRLMIRENHFWPDEHWEIDTGVDALKGKV